MGTGNDSLINADKSNEDKNGNELIRNRRWTLHEKIRITNGGVSNSARTSHADLAHMKWRKSRAQNEIPNRQGQSTMEMGAKWRNRRRKSWHCRPHLPDNRRQQKKGEMSGIKRCKKRTFERTFSKVGSIQLESTRRDLPNADDKKTYRETMEAIFD
jgi:hypothetical protein